MKHVQATFFLLFNKVEHIWTYHVLKRVNGFQDIQKVLTKVHQNVFMQHYLSSLVSL